MIKVYVMATCPDCMQVKAEASKDARFELIDLGTHVRFLKEFLVLRDSHPAFDKVKERGNIGLPCFVMEDGSIDFSWERVKQRIGWKADAVAVNAVASVNDVASVLGSAEASVNDAVEGAACSLDGKGC